MPRMFADLHCHPTLYGFNHMRNSPAEGDSARNHPWHTPSQNSQAMAAGRRATNYSQCDVAKMSASGLRLCFASITPIEVGFFKASESDPGRETSFGGEALKLASGATALRSLTALLRGERGAALDEVTGILRNNGPLRRLVHSLVLRYSQERLKHFLSGRYDYWEEFEEELAYLQRRDGVRSEAQIQHEDGHAQAVSGLYHLIRDARHLQEVIEGDDEAVALVLSIEGGHTFSIGPDQERLPEEVIFERVQKLKALPTPILFITLAHHFDNGLCGHAHSIPGVVGALTDQRRRMNEGFEAQDDLGMRVTRSLLDLNEDLEPLGGRRILIDTKHMSPLTRRQYYSRIIDPYNAAHPERPIPVLISHGAYSGVATLDEAMANADKETNGWRAGLFNAWGINATDEDVRAVHRSRGLIGLILEERILGTPGQTEREALPQVLMQQLGALVDVIMVDHNLSDDEKRRVWDCICLGTDFDGVIDPLTCYPTALSLPTLADDLRAWLSARAQTRFIDDIGVDTLVEKICWRNAYDFAVRELQPV